MFLLRDAVENGGSRQGPPPQGMHNFLYPSSFHRTSLYLNPSPWASTIHYLVSATTMSAALICLFLLDVGALFSLWLEFNYGQYLFSVLLACIDNQKGHCFFFFFVWNLFAHSFIHLFLKMFASSDVSQKHRGQRYPCGLQSGVGGSGKWINL